MQSFAALRATTNPYLKQLYAATTTAECTPATFSWSGALRGDFDVLHVHWPEVLLRGAGGPRTWLRRLAFSFVLLRIRTSRRALVRTLHNVAPHEEGPVVERALLRWCDRVTTLWITLVPSTPVPAVSRAPRRTILHGHYRDWFAAVSDGGTVPVTGRFLYFGLIRPYKGVEQLLAAFTAVDDAGAALRVVGGVKDADLGTHITDTVAGDPRVSARLAYVEDAELALEVLAAELVVLPYREMHNSGSALLALSLGRPILVPDNAVTRDLADEVGPGWVQTFHGELTASDLSTALAAVRTGRSTAPDLSGREWPVIGAAHIAAYRAALRARRSNR